jgi:hypothetical protein
MITMKHGVREGKYSLKFRVQDRKHTQGRKSGRHCSVKKCKNKFFIIGCAFCKTVGE